MKLTPSQRKVLEAKAEVDRLWALMCQYDAIDPTSKFVIFSDRNPFTSEYGDAMARFGEARRAEKKNAARRARHAAYTDLGLKRVRGALGGVYYE